MVNSIGYIQRHYQEKQDIKAEKFGSHCKLRNRNATVVKRRKFESLIVAFHTRETGN